MYISPSGEQYGKGPDMKKYVDTMLQRVVGGDSTAGLDRKLIEEGDIISQDDLDNLVSLHLHASLWGSALCRALPCRPASEPLCMSAEHCAPVQRKYEAAIKEILEKSEKQGAAK